MAAQLHLTELEELTWLRARVAELERQTSERTRQAVALDDSRELFDAFLTYLPAFAWMKDEAGRYVYANRHFLQLSGQTETSCLGRTDQELWPAASVNAERQVDGQDSVETLPAAGGERRFRVRRFPFRSKAGKLYFAGIAFDFDERSQHLFENGLIGIMECSGESVVDANDTLLRWIGYSRDEIGQLNWRALTPSRYRSHDDEALGGLQSRGSWPPYEKELLDRNCVPFPVLVSGKEIKSGSGSFFWFVLNMGERRQLESRLLRSQKLESLGLIAGGVAHDFNNLLATIMGNASLSLDAISREHRAFKPLGEVVIASRRASDLTQQVLAYAGRAAFQVKATELSAIIREIGSLLETTISKKITLKLDLASGLPLIDADEGQLQQIVMNLVINASDAIGENPGEITVSSRAIETFEQGKGVAFEVRDTGCGMDEATRARIFDPFFTTKAQGRGLGLAAVLGIVKNHRGALLVESELGVGTTFRVVFPASQAPQPEPPKWTRPRQELWGNETILVVDDDEGIRRMSRAALERLGYRVLLASDGEEAVKVFQEHRNEIAVVLLDWAMPVMNGDEALTRMLAIDPSAKIMMSSGYAETETLQRIGTPPLAGFVQKPYTTTQLAEALRGAIASAARKR